MGYAVIFLAAALLPAASGISVEWDAAEGILRSTPTLQAHHPCLYLTVQLVTNPLVERKSPVHDNVFQSLQDLNASFARFSMWFPYPHVAVAELDPPSANSTSWDFKYMDPLVEDFMSATQVPFKQLHTPHPLRAAPLS
jgi:hypothetical protein